ncbi:MAG: sigma factor-like helix-turn-helix DNA-binding protein [Bacillota bacterium]|nr:sigma factor-like helix-turn-helix DNA-binding protein [Bacillota bacterium]
MLLIEETEESRIANYRMLLKRAAWRMQYKIRTQHDKECKSFLDYLAYNRSFETEVLSDIYVNDLLKIIPSGKCRYIIQKTVIEEMTEKEVACELKITQQAVSKWKKKGLETLRQSLSRSC